jgi:tRNA threonylcarbamoyladenosine biosynthesis protein TsaE
VIINAFDLNDLPQVARQVIAACGDNTVWLLEGQMGAGKTTLIKAICRELGVLNNVQSPTFSIVNEYVTHSGDTIYHFDCYRLKSETEAYYIGVEEYLDSGYLCLIEWADRIASLLPQKYALIAIKEVEGGKRELQVSTSTPVS